MSESRKPRSRPYHQKWFAWVHGSSDPFTGLTEGLDKIKNIRWVFRNKQAKRSAVLTVLGLRNPWLVGKDFQATMTTQYDILTSSVITKLNAILWQESQDKKEPQDRIVSSAILSKMKSQLLGDIQSTRTSTGRHFRISSKEIERIRASLKEKYGIYLDIANDTVKDREKFGKEI